MSFYGSKGQPGLPSGGGQRTNLQSQSEVNLTPQLFNFTQSQLQFQAGHNMTFPDPNNPQLQMQNIQLGGAPQQQLLMQQQSNFPNLNVNFLTEQIGVGQILPSANQSQSINLITPLSVCGMTFANTAGIQTQPPTTQQPQQAAKQRVFTGQVTKIHHDDFGFIDEDVFFHMSVVKGPILPKPGDRVLVEADFNPTMPFHWNATRVQIVNMGGSIMGGNMNLNPGKPLSPQPNQMTLSSQANQSVLQAAQHTTASLINMNQFNTSTAKSNQPQNQNVMSQSGVQQSQANRYPTNSSAVSNSNSPYGGGRNNNNMSRAEDSRVIAHSRAPMTRPPPPCITTPTSSINMVSLPPMVDAHSHGMQHLQLPMQLPMSAVPLQLPSLNSLNRDVGAKDRERDARERERERDARERERDREKDRREKRSMEDKKQRERERERQTVRSHERSSKRGKDDGIKTNDKEKEKNDTSSTRPIRNRSPIPPRDSRKRSRSKEKPRENLDTTSRERTKSRSPSPKRLAVLSRPTPRYGWELPKISLDETQVNVSELKRRYKNLYIPSDFFLAKCSWQETLPLHIPLDLTHSCPVHIFRRYPEKVELEEYTCSTGNSNNHIGNDISPSVSLTPPDESDSLKVKVILLSTPNKANLYKKACGLAAESDVSLQHLNRLLNFVVGTKMSKNETMIIGGAWSPSLDGQNSESPQVLINTAIRTCKALTGLDLRRCTKWYRFMELYYRRSSGILETVVVLLPNLWTALPNRKEWEEIQKVYKEALHVDKEKTEEGKNPNIVKDRNSKVNGSENTPNHENSGDSGTTSSQQQNSGGDKTTLGSPHIKSLVKMEALEAEVEDGELKEEMDTSDKNHEEFDIYGDLPSTPATQVVQNIKKEPVEGKENEVVQTMDNQNNEGEKNTNKDSEGQAIVGDVPKITTDVSESESSFPAVVEIDASSDNLEKDTTIEEADEEITPKEENKGTHFSLLDPKHMTVPKLKEELSRRGLSTKGLKSQLMTRLLKTLKAEESAEKLAQNVEKSNDDKSKVDEPMEVTESVHPVEMEVVASAIHTEGELTESVQEVEQSCTIKDSESSIHKSSLDSPLKNEKSVVVEGGENGDKLPSDDRTIKVNENGSSGDTSASSAPSTNGNKKSGLTVQVPVFLTSDICDNEKTRKIWERRYTLPKSSHLLLHPSHTAKSGVFDCNQHSLNTLRDYRVADNKEQSFEVSLCAEFFHEMLQRDFAFRIYRELVYQAKKVGSNPSSTIASKTSKTEDTKKDDDAKDDKGVNGLSSKEESQTKKRKLSSSSSVTGTTKSTVKTIDPHLLLAFVFFDHTRCGYITDGDLEDLCLSLNLGLTRAQIRKLVQKVVVKGVLHYRKWTDIDENSSNLDSLTARDDCTEESLKQLAQGNQTFLPIFGRTRCSISESLEFQEMNLHSESDNTLKKETESILAQVTAVCDGDATLVDIKKLRDQLEKSEKERASLDSKLRLYKNSLNEAKVQIGELKISQDMVKEELNRVKEVLKQSEAVEASNQADLEIFRYATARFVDRVKDLIKSPVKDLKCGKEFIKKEKPDENSTSE